MKTAKSTSDNIFSKIDPSGTDPNRYATVNKPSRKSWTETSLIPGKPVNVSMIERIAMIAAGGYLLYKGLSAKNKTTRMSTALAGGTMLFRGASGYCPVYESMEKSKSSAPRKIVLKQSVIINKPAQEVYGMWRNLKNLPDFLTHISKVEEKNKLESEWTAKGPAGIGSVSWRAHILDDVPGKMLSWQSLPGSSVYNNGKLNFTEIGPSLTRMDLSITYRAPLGAAGQKVAEWLNPTFEKELARDLEKFRAELENDPSLISQN